jgi:hypothetical protein
MTYTRLIEELKEFKHKSWDGMPEENIDAAIVIIDKMHRLQKMVVHANLNTDLTEDEVKKQMMHASLNEIAEETWRLYCLATDMRDIIMEEPDND